MLLRHLLFPILISLPTMVAAGGIEWTVQPDFESKTAAKELSGAVCGNSTRWCVAVNDETRYVQWFELLPQERRLKPGKRSLVLPTRRADGSKYKEPDIEAAAYADGFVYLTGSHGTGRKTALIQPSRFFVYRLPVDRTSGRPLFEITLKKVAPEIERSGALREAINNHPYLAKFAQNPPEYQRRQNRGYGGLE